MISKETLRKVVIKQKERKKIENLVTRDMLNEVIKHLKDKRVLIISGLRRSGKSTLLFEIMDYLESRNENYCYVNFEDERFLDFKAQDFDVLEEVLMEIYGDFNIYFFDEIQNIHRFESFVRRLHDEGKKIILTGSNSSLLSKEFGTRLTGRYKLFELYPFSFKEFLRRKNIEIGSTYLSKERAKIFNQFKEYFESGGIPEYLENKDADYIKTLYDNIIYKDIISRYSVRNQKIFREMVNLLLTNVACQFTYNSLRNSLGLSNAITAKEYISFLANTYLFFELQRYDYSVKRQLNLPKKIYLVDHIFNKVMGLNFSENRGKILENITFIELKRRYNDVYYDVQECDFLIKKNAKLSLAIQVCFELNDENKDRELKGIKESMKKYNIKKGLILTYDQAMEIEGVKVIPVWQYLLGFTNLL